jgi:hypothetical protein
LTGSGFFRRSLLFNRSAAALLFLLRHLSMISRKRGQVKVSGLAAFQEMVLALPPSEA